MTANVFCLTAVIPVLAFRIFRIRFCVSGFGIVCCRMIRNCMANCVYRKIAKDVLFAEDILSPTLTERNIATIAENILFVYRRLSASGNSRKCHGLGLFECRCYAKFKIQKTEGGVITLQPSVCVFKV